MKMRYSFGVYLSMAALLPYHEYLAHCHLLYMFGHAGILHYLFNGFAWILLWKITTRIRTLLAWLCAVVCSYIIPSSSPVLGFSVIIYFYMGICLSSMNGGRRNRLIALTAISFFMPHIAAAHHAVMLVLGCAYRKMEVTWERTL